MGDWSRYGTDILFQGVIGFLNHTVNASGRFRRINGANEIEVLTCTCDWLSPIETDPKSPIVCFAETRVYKITSTFFEVVFTVAGTSPLRSLHSVWLNLSSRQDFAGNDVNFFAKLSAEYFFDTKVCNSISNVPPVVGFSS